MGCVASVQLALSDLPGVHEVTVDLGAGQAHLIYDPTQVTLEQMANAVAEAGYQMARSGTEAGEEIPSVSRRPLIESQVLRTWRRPILFGLLGTVGLLILYLAEDAWIVGPILAGFGVQVGLYTYLKTVIQAAARGTGALAGAGGGTSTVAMVACCAHHVTDVLPLVGLSAAATFLAEYRIPFMLVGLGTNLIGIGVIVMLILRTRRRLVGATPATQPTETAAACH
jgi:copper chaperone CopZ